MIYQRIKGTHDILPPESAKWQYLEKFIRDYLHRNNYQEIRTPAFEVTELFTRSIGTDTDVVAKEMYTFFDKGQTSLTLKPELTAPVMRAYLQNNMEQVAPLTKVYYIDALYRQERPQKGRLRQFHQFGYEIIGSAYPETDAEVIQTIYELYRELGIDDLQVRINSIGSRSARQRYLELLKQALQPHAAAFCSTCRERLTRNVLRLFDCKVASCQTLLDARAPFLIDHLDQQDREHFAEVCRLLETVQVPYLLDKKLVRGLDYYSRTTFEITSGLLGSQDALCGGGRYDYLIADLGGKPTPGIGVASGMERVLLVLEQLKAFPESPSNLLYLIALGEMPRQAGFQLLTALRKQGLCVEMDFLRRSLKAQLRDASRAQARWVIIMGEDELARGQVILKRMSDGQQTPLNLPQAADEIARLVQ